MSPTLDYFHCPCFNPKNDTVLLIDADAPEPGQISLKRFRFSFTLLTITVNIIYVVHGSIQVCSFA